MRNVQSTGIKAHHDLPTPESPMMSNLNEKNAIRKRTKRFCIWRK
jgi:hypothetical protein